MQATAVVNYNNGDYDFAGRDRVGFCPIVRTEFCTDEATRKCSKEDAPKQLLLVMSTKRDLVHSMNDTLVRPHSMPILHIDGENVAVLRAAHTRMRKIMGNAMLNGSFEFRIPTYR